ncbi:response regulator [Xinfangfangia sp. CPCC 101601]|uniref:Response regulator n=1 Tax=Pseudogemmobacter lacusdianii TaxID=3069608 RepID=A0ABU0VUB3_9RHOB|nr:response regulator [Xinfangfangia sp. CPCC 101601]MDQ2065322.1 response regulator [Xinfangfangia sp. CPCC 101601]
MTEAPLILCVEDEQQLLTDVTDELTEAGYRVLAARDGAEAVRRITDVTPDLVLCDISMPVADGYVLLDHVKAHPQRFAHVPFIFFTALGASEEIVRAKRLGADDYLVKPVDYDLLLATIEARLRQVGLIRHSAAKAALPTNAVLDLLARPVCLVGRTGELLFRNRAAIGVIGPGSNQPYSAAHMRQLLDRHAQAAVFTAAPATGLHMVICRLGAHDAEAVVFLGAEEAADVLSEERTHRLAEAFGFTSTESRIAALLCAGLSPSEISQKLSIASTTTAFHLKNLFQKTGTGRQAALVAKLLSHPTALIQD